MHERVIQRIMGIVNLPPNNAEHMQLLKYGPNECAAPAARGDGTLPRRRRLPRPRAKKSEATAPHHAGTGWV